MINILRNLFGGVKLPQVGDGRCQKCGAKMKSEVRRWPPLAKDGADTLHLRCPKCGHEERITLRIGV